MSKHTKYVGFTLIELLVVIATISILSSILFPVFARARENARRTSCLSNLKQIGLGIMQYTQDFDERYPLAYYPYPAYGEARASGPAPKPPAQAQTDARTPGRSFLICDPHSCGAGYKGSWITWMDFIHPYVKSSSLFRCPSVPTSDTTPSYNYSNAYSNVFGAATNYGQSMSEGGLPMAAVLRPAEVAMVVDINDLYALSLSPRVYIGAWNAATRRDTVIPHFDGGNVVYGDGHAKWISAKSMLADIGTDSAGNCNLNSPSNISYCSRAWNPFRS